MPDFDMPPASAGFPARGRWLIDRLMGEFGLTDYQAAGIVGNLGYESIGLATLQEIAPAVPGSRGGFGWAQWTGPRRREFEAWCRGVGLAPASDEANYGFLLIELHGSHAITIDRLHAMSSLENAVWSVGQTYERPGGTTTDHLPGFDGRLRYAKQALAGGGTAALEPTRVPDGLAAAYLAVARLDEPERKLVQIGLKAVGVKGPDGRDVGEADGIIGPRTKAALAVYRGG